MTAIQDFDLDLFSKQADRFVDSLEQDRHVNTDTSKETEVTANTMNPLESDKLWTMISDHWKCVGTSEEAPKYNINNMPDVLAFDETTRDIITCKLSCEQVKREGE